MTYTTLPVPRCQICKAEGKEVWNRNIGGLVADRCHTCSEAALKEDKAKGPKRGKM